MTKLFLALVSLCAQSFSATPTLGPYSTAVNISVDLIAARDARPAAWGGAASFASKVAFHPPTGYRTRIIHVYGDFIAWPKSGKIVGDQRLEIGFGLKTTAPDGSIRVTFPGYAATPYDNSFVWVQDGLDADNTLRRIHLDYDTCVGGLLEADNVLLAQSFIAIDTTGLLIHMEPTLVVIYQFEAL